LSTSITGHSTKLVGKLYDQCQDTLVQLGTFLASNLSVDDYTRRLPSLGSLLVDYHVHADVAFFLARPMFSHSINSKYDELRRAEKNSKNLLPAQKTQKYLEAVRHVMGPVCESVRPLCAPRVWEDLSPQFFATFWSLTVNDLVVPTAAYEREVVRLRQAIQQSNDNMQQHRDPAARRKEKKVVDCCTSLIDKLIEEEKKQKDNKERIMARLTQERDGWFLCRSAKLAKTETITQFLQLCLFPRCVFTSIDALFCARFVQVMHNLRTPNFSTLICYDRIFCDITYTVTSCTENEANRYGRFLCAMLETVMHWHSSKKIFDDECANYPGFVTKFRVGNQPSETNDHVDFENYRHVVHKWHHKIAKALVVCLESKDYVQIRNALIVLIRILPYFPVIIPLGSVIERNVETVRTEQKDKRQDLFAMAYSYSGQLKNKKSVMIPESEFHVVTKRPAVKPAATAAVSNPTPAPHVDAIKHEGSNGVDKHSADSQEKISPVQSESQSNASKESKKDAREAKERSKEKERSKDSGDKREDGTERSREKRTKDRREDRADERGYANIKGEREEEWPERDNFSGATAESSDPDRESKRRKTDAIVTTKSRQSSPDRERHLNKAERKERRNAMESEEERRERKGDRKRNHLVEESPADLKRRKEDEKTRSPRNQNGSPSDVEKRIHNRESPLSREAADRSYERQDRQRRSNEVKRR